MFSLRSIVSRNSAATSAILRRPIHSTSKLRNASASESDIYSKLNDGERAIYDKLKAEFGSKTLDVVDVSGMFPLGVINNTFLTLSHRWMWFFLCHTYFLTSIQGTIDNQAAQACQSVSEGGSQGYSRTAGALIALCSPLMPLLMYRRGQLKTVAED